MISQLSAPELDPSSVFEMALQEARRHRWLESQFARRDLGDDATYDWYRKYWNTFIRYRHVEHLVGEKNWEEFGNESFGILRKAFQEQPLMYDIVELYRNGYENLNIIDWAFGRKHCMDAVYDCLIAINMNNARLDPRFE